MSDLSDLGKWISNSITVKLVMIGFLFLILIIPSSMIQSLVNEREQLSNSVVEEIGSKWGGSQVVSGPVITVPFKKLIQNQDKLETVIEYAHFLPEKLNINDEVIPEIRYRGMYKVVVYRSKISLAGSFKKPDFAELGINPADVLLQDATLSLGIPDMRGIREAVEIELGDQQYQANPGLKNRDVIETGVTTPVDLTEMEQKGEVSFSVSLSLNGSGMAGFIPMGKETDVHVISAWNNPSFEGSFLPDDRQLNDSGFTAHWKVLHLNREFPQQWIGKSFETDKAAFGVRFLFPVDHYQKALRAVKYAVMFTSLTFLVFFFIEILNRKRVHPVQYLLVGVALMIFYTLLLSISEQLSFNLAYLISSLAVISLIGLYAGSIFKSLRMGLITTGFLGFLYGFLFILLQLQDYALLLGSIGLFIVIATVMFLSRKVNWYPET
jgi:inner membrane protein